LSSALFRVRHHPILLSHVPDSLQHCATRLAKSLPVLVGSLFMALAACADTGSQPHADTVVWPYCMSELLKERATIERVTDGDTVVLTDQRRVRLIGINAAELNARHPKLKKAAQQATDKLKAWLPRGESVVLYLGDEAHDRHGRVLAHVVRASDGLAVAQLLVQNGLSN